MGKLALAIAFVGSLFAGVTVWDHPPVSGEPGRNQINSAKSHRGTLRSTTINR